MPSHLIASYQDKGKLRIAARQTSQLIALTLSDNGLSCKWGWMVQSLIKSIDLLPSTLDGLAAGAL